MPRVDWTDAEDEALVLAAQAGDLSAFDRLAHRYRPAGLLIARRFMDRERAEDVVQDALLAAYKALPQLRSADRFPGWFAAIVRHRSNRALGQPEHREQSLSQDVDRLIVKGAPSIAMRQPDAVTDAEEALASLPEAQREIAELYYVQGCSVGVIAGLLSLTNTTVKWRLHQIRGSMRRHCLQSTREE